MLESHQNFYFPVGSFFLAKICFPIKIYFLLVSISILRYDKLIKTVFIESFSNNGLWYGIFKLLDTWSLNECKRPPRSWYNYPPLCYEYTERGFIKKVLAREMVMSFQKNKHSQIYSSLNIYYPTNMWFAGRFSYKRYQIQIMEFI